MPRCDVAQQTISGVVGPCRSYAKVDNADLSSAPCDASHAWAVHADSRRDAAAVRGVFRIPSRRYRVAHPDHPGRAGAASIVGQPLISTTLQLVRPRAAVERLTDAETRASCRESACTARRDVAEQTIKWCRYVRCQVSDNATHPSAAAPWTLGLTCCFHATSARCLCGVFGLRLHRSDRSPSRCSCSVLVRHQRLPRHPAAPARPDHLGLLNPIDERGPCERRRGTSRVASRMKRGRRAAPATVSRADAQKRRRSPWTRQVGDSPA